MELGLGIRNIKPKYPEIAQEMRQQLGKLDGSICNTFFWPGINQLLLHYLKTELRQGKQAIFRAKCHWLEQANAQQNIFLNMGKKEIITKRPLGNLA